MQTALSGVGASWGPACLFATASFGPQRMWVHLLQILLTGPEGLSSASLRV